MGDPLPPRHFWTWQAGPRHRADVGLCQFGLTREAVQRELLALEKLARDLLPDDGQREQLVRVG